MCEKINIIIIMKVMETMNTKNTLLFFGIPGLLMMIAMNYLLPLALQRGIALHWAVFFAVWSPIMILFVLVLHFRNKSGQPFFEFFRVTRICKKCWLVTILAFFVVQVGELALAPTRGFLASLPYMNAPDFYPALFKPDYMVELPLKIFMGMNVQGNSGVLFFWALWIIVNIVGEELLWRGYALPRMEKYFGKWAWLVNGLLWNFAVHMFMRWSWITLLPISLIIPFLCQKTKSIWPGVFIHGLGNLLVFVILIPSVMA